MASTVTFDDVTRPSSVRQPDCRRLLPSPSRGTCSLRTTTGGFGATLRLPADYPQVDFCGPKCGEIRPPEGSGHGQIPPWTRFTVFVVALGTALATGLGALPFFFGRPDRNWLGVANSLASGSCWARPRACATRVPDTDSYERPLGAVAGVIFIGVSERIIGRGQRASHRFVTGCRRAQGTDDRGSHDPPLVRGGGWSRSGLRRRGDVRRPDRCCDRSPQHPRGSRDKPRPRPSWNVSARSGRLEHLLESPTALDGGPRISVHREVLRSSYR